MGIGGWARAAALLLGLAACAPATTATTAAEATTATQPTQADTPWPEFRVPGADFAVSLPQKPALAKEATAEDGSLSRTYQVSQGPRAYIVAYAVSVPTSDTSAPLDGWLDDVRDGVVARLEAKLRSERRLTLGDARGMELVLDVPESDDGDAYTIRGRFYVKHAGTGADAKDMLYQTLAAGDPGSEADAPVTRFLDSFHFIDQ